MVADTESKASYRAGNCPLHGDYAGLVVGEGAPLPDWIVDTALSTQTIEHVLDVDAYLVECGRLLKPHGTSVLIAPNALASPRSIVRFSSIHALWPDPVA